MTAPSRASRAVADAHELVAGGIRHGLERADAGAGAEDVHGLGGAVELRTDDLGVRRAEQAGVGGVESSVVVGAVRELQRGAGHQVPAAQELLQVGFGRIVALHHRSSTLLHIRYHIPCLPF
jgi:hypothetical protein